MAEDNKAKVANGANKAVHAGKAVAKGASGNYVGAAKDIAIGFGDDILKAILSFLLAIFFLSSSLFSVFATTPSILTHNFLDDFNKSMDKWQITKVCDAVEKKIDNLKKDVEKEIVENIENGYIDNFKKKCSKFDSENQVWTGNGNNKQIFIICKDGNDVDAFEAVMKDNSYMSETGDVYFENFDTTAKKVNFNNILNSNPNEKTDIDPLYFVCAYSVWHQSNDVNISDDSDYNEPENIEDRWYDFSEDYDLTNDIKGLKKFIKNHQDDFISVDYSYQKEKLPLNVKVEHKEMETDEDGNVKVDKNGNVVYKTIVKTEKINFTTEAINIYIDIATNDEILDMFELNDKEKQLVDSIYLVTKSLYEGAYEDYQNENISFNPKFQIINDIMHLTDSDTNTEIYKAIKNLDKISATYQGESTNQGDKPSKPDNEDNKEDKIEAGVPTGYMIRPTKVGIYSKNPTFPYYSSGGYHAGYDISVPTGTKVYAAECGTVVSVKHLNYSYGYHIVIKSGDYYFYYCHLSSTDNTKVGDKVKQGELIGKSGSTGNSSGPHLHFEVRKNDNYHSVINPYNFMNKNKTYINAKTYG